MQKEIKLINKKISGKDYFYIQIPKTFSDDMELNKGNTIIFDYEPSAKTGKIQVKRGQLKL